MFELTFDVSVVSLLYPLTLGAAVYTVGHQDVKHFKVFELLGESQLTFATVTPSLLQLLSPYFDEINLPSLEISGSIGRSIANRAVGAIQRIGTQRNVHQPIRTDRSYDLLHLLPYSGFGQMQALQRNGGYRKTISRHPRHHCRRRRKRATSRRDGRTLGIRPAGNEGYLDDPEKSALVLIHRPDGQIYYRTGDMCILDLYGDIIYCGRKDYQVKIQGFRIELSEVEYTAQSFFKTPCSVAAVPLLCDGICNELHLAVETTECTQSALIEYLKEKLPKYMLPKQIHCISQFPVTNSNKTDRKKIAELIKEKKL